MEAWEEVLSDHPNAEFRDYILDGIINGVNIGHSGQHSNIICKNWPSVNKYHNAVEDIIRQDVARGRKVGPFHTPPEHFVGSPLGAFEKKHTPGKYRVIHDLSWPPGQSVNEQITEDCSVHYVTIDDIVNQVKSFGVKGVKMSKLDLENAYKHIFVRVEDRHLLGITWDTTNSDELPIREYYLDITLPFGLKSSAKHFTLYADGLQYAMTKNGVSKVSHSKDKEYHSGEANHEAQSQFNYLACETAFEMYTLMLHSDQINMMHYITYSDDIYIWKQGVFYLGEKPKNLYFIDCSLILAN